MSPTPAARAAFTIADLTALYSGSSDAVYAVDEEQRIVFLNRRAEEILGLTMGEAVGRSCFDVVAGTNYSGACICRADCSTIAAARRGLAMRDYDVLAHPEAAPRRWVNMGITVVNVEGFERPIAVHMARDLSSRREMMPEAEQAGRPAGAANLTARETDVLRMLAAGATVRQIAQHYVVTPATVRNHIENLMGKLGVHSRLQAVARAGELGLL